MEENNRATLRRTAVLLVLFVSHGTLLLVFLRERPACKEHPPSPEVPTTIFFINPQQRLAQSEIPRTPALGSPDRATEAPSTRAPWDSRPLLEFTGHGLQVRIPLEIPGTLIDHCFGKMDLGHEQQTGQWERYQLGCALRKQPPRGDLFDSLRKPPEPRK